MQTETIQTGNVGENCFLVTAGNTLCIIDPGADADLIIKRIEEKNIHFTHIEVLFTHAHADHIGAAGALKKRFPEAVFRLDSNDKAIYLSEDNAFPPYIPLAENLPATVEYQENSVYSILPCPGHTPGGVSLLFDDNGVQHLYSGDTLFAGSIGRTDFEGGSLEELSKTLRMLTEKLDDSVIVHPGHGPDTTIGREKISNVYLKHLI